MRKTGEFEYLRVLELTKKGWPHYHLLVRSSYRHYSVIRESWATHTGAKIVDVRKVRDGDSMYWYLVKYLSKQVYCEFTERRLSWTNAFFPPKKEMPSLYLMGHERENYNLHTWIKSRGREITLNRISAYMFSIG